MIVECDHCHSQVTIAGEYRPEDITMKPCQNCGKNDWSIVENARLKACPDCGNMISKKAVMCPLCGAMKKEDFPVRVYRFTPAFGDYVGAIICFILALLVVSVLVVLLIIVLLHSIKAQ